jgi:predicted dehydrogenase
MTARSELRFGILGTSGHASRVAAPALKQSRGVVLTGAAGSTADGAKRFAEAHGLARAYGSLKDLLADPDIDAVWICSPNHLHALHIKQCAAARKHVLVEKPIATTRADALDAAKAAGDAGITLRVGCQHRFRASHAHIRQLILSGAVGRMGYMRIHRFWRYPYYDNMDPSGPPAWRRSPGESGGWIINDIGSHLLDLMLWMSGMDASFAGAIMASQQFDVATEDSTAVMLRLGDTGIGIVETSCANESPGSRIEVYGSSGWIRADDTLSATATVHTHAGAPTTFPAVAMMDTYFAAVADFLAAVRGEPSAGADARAGAAVAGLIESAMQGGLQARSLP